MASDNTDNGSDDLEGLRYVLRGGRFFRGGQGVGRRKARELQLRGDNESGVVS